MSQRNLRLLANQQLQLSTRHRGYLGNEIDFYEGTDYGTFMELELELDTLDTFEPIRKRVQPKSELLAQE